MMRWVSIAMAVTAVLVPRSASAGDYVPLNCAKASSSSCDLRVLCLRATGSSLYGIATSLVAMGQLGDRRRAEDVVEDP